MPARPAWRRGTTRPSPDALLVCRPARAGRWRIGARHHEQQEVAQRRRSGHCRQLPQHGGERPAHDGGDVPGRPQDVERPPMAMAAFLERRCPAKNQDFPEHGMNHTDQDGQSGGTDEIRVHRVSPFAARRCRATLSHAFPQTVGRDNTPRRNATRPPPDSRCRRHSWTGLRRADYRTATGHGAACSGRQRHQLDGRIGCGRITIALRPPARHPPCTASLPFC